MATLLEYKCPACGGALSFDSGLQKMKCPYCDTEFAVDALQELDEALENPTPDDMTWQTQAGGQWQAGEAETLRGYICQSCGGEILTDATTGATHCPFCGNPVVMTGQFAGDLKPDLVIPFQLDKEAAKAALAKHLSGKPLLPKVFKSENKINEIKGVYVPFWLFDAEAEADIRYRATRVRVWSDSRYDYTQTSHFSIHRAGTIGFAGVPVDGSTKMADDLMESIEPYDLSQAVDFQTAYLAGCLADKYDVTAQQSIQRANARIKTSTEENFARTVSGYTTVVPASSSVKLQNGTARYALYPVWLLTSTYKEKQYTFAMNGQTGKFVGDLPMDVGAYWRWWACITAVASALAYGLAWLLR